MALFDRVRNLLRRPAATVPGVARATVVSHADPAGEGRVQVAVHPDDGTQPALWARTATLMAGADRGSWFIPDVGEDVVVAFEAGDPQQPVVVGSLWSATARPPDQIGPDNGRRSVVTRSGARIMIDDTGGDCVVTLRTAHGHHVTLADDTTSTVTIADTSGNTIELGPGGITISSPSKLRLMASTVELSAGAVALDTAMVTAAGTVKCDTLIATSVIATSYTPGAGNLQ